MIYNEFKTVVVFVDDTVKTYRKRTKLKEITEQNHYIIENLEDSIYNLHGQERIKSITTEFIIK